MGKRKTHEQFEAELFAKRGDTITALGKYVNNSTPILFGCQRGHEWPARPHSVLNLGSGCPNCAGQIVTNEEFRAKLYARHGGKITALEPYVNAHTKILFRCNHGHEWPAEPASVLSGRGCPECANINSGIRLLKTNEQFIADLRTKHGDKITALQPYVNSATPMLFRCEKCGNEWRTTPVSILQNGCPECGKVRQANARRTTDEEFRAKVYAKYGSALIVLGEYVNAYTKILFVSGHGWDVNGNYFHWYND